MHRLTIPSTGPTWRSRVSVVILATLALVSAWAGFAPPSEASDHCPVAFCGRDSNDGVRDPGSGPPSGGSTPPASSPLWGVHVDAGGAPDGGDCWRVVNPAANPVGDVYAAEDEGRKTGLPRCVDGSDGVDPWSWLAGIDVPAPSPHVANGTALTGVPVYLEIRDAEVVEETFEHPFDGPDLTLRATPAFTVHWRDHAGDADAVTHTEHRGQPWPGGDEEITWVYEVHERTTIRVVAEWTGELRWEGGDWQPIDSAHGTPVVTTEGTFDLPVRQVQAVRAR